VKKALRTYATDFAAILVLGVIAAGVGGYILANQRVRFPWESKPYVLKAAFTTAQAVTPGQGQTVRVSGIRIGDISKVDLIDGRAVVSMDVDPKYKGLVHTDATALLRPKTGLKDMFVELSPGSNHAPVAKGGWTIPVANTLPDVNPDEVYGALDADARDYLRLLVDGAGQGLKGRGKDLREVFRRFEPTHRDLAKVTEAVAARQGNLRHLIHSLNVLNGELAGKGDQLSQLVDSSAAVFRSFASQGGNISRTVAELPGALRQTTQTLNNVKTYADVLGPAATDLVPTAHAIDRANHAIRPFAIEAAPILAKQIRPFVRQSRPLVRSLRPAAASLAKSTPDLTRSFVVLNHLFNLIGFNSNGREGPEVAKRDEGYLYWIAWLLHNGAAVFGTADANGTLRPVAQIGTCASIAGSIQALPAQEFLQGLSGVLTDPKVCGSGG